MNPRRKTVADEPVSCSEGGGEGQVLRMQYLVYDRASRSAAPNPLIFPHGFGGKVLFWK